MADERLRRNVSCWSEGSRSRFRRNAPSSTFHLSAFFDHLSQKRNVAQRRFCRFERPDVRKYVRRLLIRQAGGAVAWHRDGRPDGRALVRAWRADERDETA